MEMVHKISAGLLCVGPVYFDPNEYDKPPCEKEVRDYAREWEGVKKLPKGFQCWPA